VSWNEHHSLSEKLAVAAENAARDGEILRAQDLYRQAASEETLALTDLAEDRQRTRGITAVSAVALSYKGRDFATAQQLAHFCLAGRVRLPEFAELQLRELLRVLWTASEAEERGVKFMQGDVLVSVQGGQVVHGGAPLDLIIRKVEGIKAILFRTVEMMLDRPFRSRGGPPTDILSMMQPWLFQAPAGSYQFAVRMQEPAQGELWQVSRPKVEDLTAKFFSILRATATDPEKELPAVVPNRQYREAFLSLSRNLSPTGATFDRLEVRSASVPTESAVTFALDTRKELNSILRNARPPSTNDGKQVEIRGVLRGLHLDQDWLEVTTDEQLPGFGEHVRIGDAGAALDDVVGPMVNRRVSVTAEQRGKRLLYRDIELEE
jgi:hypothetical protein